MVHYFSTELGAYVKDKYGYRLTVLDLKGAGLFMVPKAVTELREKKILVLDENKLVELPVSIKKLKNLILLNLKNNKLTKLPVEKGDLRELRELSMSNNQLVGFPTSIQRLTKLKLAVLEWK